jgi:hypothetical protein
VKVIVKFIRKEIQYNRIKVRRNGGKGRNISCPHAGTGSKDSSVWF